MEQFAEEGFKIFKSKVGLGSRNLGPVLFLIGLFGFKTDVVGMFTFFIRMSVEFVGVVGYVSYFRLFVLVYLRNKRGDVEREDCWEGFWKTVNGLDKMDVEKLCEIGEKWEGDGTEYLKVYFIGEVMKTAEEKVVKGGRREEIRNREKLEKVKEKIRKTVESQYSFDGVSDLLKIMTVKKSS